MSESGLLRLTQCCSPNLQFLNISGLFCVSDSVLGRILEPCCDQLRYLNISYNSGVSGNVIPTKPLKRLENLEVRCLSSLTAAGLTKLLGAGPSLKHLDLSENPILGFTDIVGPLPHLDSLKLRKLKIEVNLIGLLKAGSQTLTSLDLSSTDLSQDAISALAVIPFKQIKQLKLCYCYLENFDLLKNCEKSLNELDISGAIFGNTLPKDLNLSRLTILKARIYLTM